MIPAGVRYVPRRILRHADGTQVPLLSINHPADSERYNGAIKPIGPDGWVYLAPKMNKGGVMHVKVHPASSSIITRLTPSPDPLGAIYYSGAGRAYQPLLFSYSTRTVG
jgi:hypothetical protein